MHRHKAILRHFSIVRPILAAKRNYGDAASKNDYVIKSRSPSLQYQDGNLANFLFQDFQMLQDKVALRCMVTKKTVTYSHLKDQIARWSGFLKRRGLRQGDTIAICSPNSLEYVAVMIGAAAIGVITSPMSSMVTSGEIAHMLTINKPKLVVYMDELESTVLEAINISKQTPLLASFGPSRKGADVLQVLQSGDIPFADPIELTGEEVFAIPFSSGTTGFPKGVMQSHNSFIRNAQQTCIPSNFSLEKATETTQYPYMVPVPFAHVGGIIMLILSLCKGLRANILPKLNPDIFVQTIIDEKIPQISIVNFLIQLLVNRPDCNREQMPDLKVVMSAGSPVPASLVENIKRKLGPDFRFQEAYGMTECLLTHWTPITENGNSGTMKLFPDVEAKVVDVETGLSLPTNEVGEIYLRTPCVMKGYADNPGATKEIIDEEGWLHSGDIGFYDKEERFTIVDRVKDLIKVKALQVSPSEIEAILVEHPKVRECCIIGVKDEYLGEAPKAFIIKNGNLGEQEIHDYLKTRLAKHKQLAGGIKFVDDFPRTNVGKVIRKDVKKWL